MPAWLIWLGVAAVLGVVEMVTLAFAAGLMASAALVTAVVAGTGADATAQALTFALSSLAALVAAQRLAARRGARGAAHSGSAPYLSGTAALANRPAFAVTQVDGSSGAVQIGGETWSARSFDDTLVIAAGTRVAIFEIEGATALVYPMEF